MPPPVLAYPRLSSRLPSPQFSPTLASVLACPRVNSRLFSPPPRVFSRPIHADQCVAVPELPAWVTCWILKEGEDIDDSHGCASVFGSNCREREC